MSNLTKMSKSKGNVINIEEITHGVYDLDESFEFRDLKNNVVNFKEINIFRDTHNTGYYFTTRRFGKLPVFLCRKEEPVPPIIIFKNIEILQHANEHEYWSNLLNKYEI